MAAETGGVNFCTNCGTQLIPGAGFCPSCGTRVGGLDAGATVVGPDHHGGPVGLGFIGTDLQLLGTGIIAFILMILIIPYGWGVSLLSGWYVNGLTFNDGRTATFTGRGSQIWYYAILILLTGFLNVIPVIGGIVG